METTPRCRQALKYAQESLSRFGHAHLSSAHLILGLLTLQGGVADNILRKSGLSVQLVEGYLSSRRTSTEESTTQDGMALGRSALLALQRAKALARARQFTYLGVEHLLLGILAEESGEAADLFASARIDREGISRTVQEEIQ
ncbi:MAG: clpA [Verrucomicrobiales bacterium]|nr:clpA [Verrucomicrobiales bacterium]